MLAAYDAYLEIGVDGSISAFIPELPGCFAAGATEDDILRNLRMAIPDYFHWLSFQDAETPTMSGDVDIVIRERFQVINNDQSEIHAFFAPDAAPMSEDDIDWAIALLSYALQDFHKQLNALPIAALDYRRSADDWSIHTVIDHVGQGQLWYMSLLDDDPHTQKIADLPGPELDRLDSIFEQALLWLRESSPQLRTKIVEHHGNRWSMRKIFRRSLNHLREHTEQIAILGAEFASK